MRKKFQRKNYEELVILVSNDDDGYLKDVFSLENLSWCIPRWKRVAWWVLLEFFFTDRRSSWFQVRLQSRFDSYPTRNFFFLILARSRIEKEMRSSEPRAHFRFVWYLWPRSPLDWQPLYERRERNEPSDCSTNRRMTAACWIGSIP